MDVAEGELADVRDKVFQVLENFDGFTYVEFFSRIRAEIDNFKKYGEFKIDGKNIKQERITINEDVSSKENSTNNEEEEPVRRSTRTKVLSEISANDCNTTQTRKVKLEKISEVMPEVIVKSEMPPPQQPARRGRKKKADESAKLSQNSSNLTNESSHYSRDSDVVLQKQSISLISVSDSDEDHTPPPEVNKIERTKKNKEIKNLEILDEAPTRTTRTKTRAKAQESNNKRDKSTDSQLSQDSSQKSTRESKTKKTKHSQLPNDEQLILKQSNEEIQKNVDETFVKIPKLNETVTRPADTTHMVEKPNADQTVVIEKPNVANETIVVHKAGQMIVTTPLNKLVDLNDLLTDDEDDKTPTKPQVKGVKPTEKTPTRPNTNAKGGPKPLFSTFENSPVKARVQAFEKLKADTTADEPPRMTRTKTKAKQTKERQESKESPEPQPSKLPVKEKSKTTPQHQNRFLPATFSSGSKLSKTTLKDIVLPAKSASALKASQQEFMDRELRRQKENEAIRKRDALLLAKKEENRRKREEKQIKAQHTRAALEKDKQKMHEEMEKIKEERYKQMIAEKNEKLQKQKEEVEAKRIMAIKKAQEEKKRAEERKMLENENGGQKPNYMDQTAPLLPTADCYDSDDDRRENGAVHKPAWSRRQNMYTTLKHIHYIGDKVRNTLFMCEATTPDLREIFEKINPKKLKRTSSAVWRKMPRFTIMPVPSGNSIREDDGDY